MLNLYQYRALLLHNLDIRSIEQFTFLKKLFSQMGPSIDLPGGLRAIDVFR